MQLKNIANFYQEKFGLKHNQAVRDAGEANFRLSREPSHKPTHETGDAVKFVQSGLGLAKGKNIEGYS
jgi:hypothetical protein